MFAFLRKTSLYILAIPCLFTFLGAASNQIVLKANHDKFPVMWNDYKIQKYKMEIEEVASGKNHDAARQARFDLDAFQHGFIDDTHVLMTDQTRFNFLADWIDLKTAIYSPGDELMELGKYLGVFCPFLFVFDVIRKLAKS